MNVGCQCRGGHERVPRTTRAQSCWRPLGSGVEHASGLSYLRGKEHETYILQSPLSRGEGCAQALNSQACPERGLGTLEGPEKALRQGVADVHPKKLPKCREAVGTEGTWAGHPWSPL